MKPELFSPLFLELCRWYGRKPSPMVVQIYYKFLQHLSEEQWRETVEWAIETQSYMPSALDLLQAVKQSAEQIWQKMLDASVELSKYRYSKDLEFKHQEQKLLGELPSTATTFLKNNHTSLLQLSQLDINYQLPTMRKSFFHFSKNTAEGSSSQIKSEIQLLG